MLSDAWNALHHHMCDRAAFGEKKAPDCSNIPAQMTMNSTLDSVCSRMPWGSDILTCSNAPFSKIHIASCWQDIATQTFASLHDPRRAHLNKHCLPSMQQYVCEMNTLSKHQPACVPATRTMSLGCGAPMRSNFRPALFSMKGIKPSLRLSTSVMEVPLPFARPVLPDLHATPNHHMH